MLHLNDKLSLHKGFEKEKNLTQYFGPEDLATIGQWVVQGYKTDLASRLVWDRRMQTAMDLAMQVQKEKSFPWPGAANIVFPLVTIAALQFNARSYTNIISGTDIVRYRVVGEDDDKGSLNKQATRIAKHMSWQVLEEDRSWEEQHDRLLINLAIMGSNFIKTYYCSTRKCVVSELVQSRDFVLDYYATSVESCSRKTQVVPFTRNEIYECVRDETFTDVLKDDWYNTLPPVPARDSKADSRQGATPPATADQDTPYRCLEQHRLLDLDQDGYAEPYIATVEESSGKLLRLVARWDREEDVRRDSRSRVITITPTEYYTKYSFISSPDGGIYDLGFGALLGPINETVSTALNQVVDTGTMMNSNGGFLGKGAKMRGGVYSLAPWEWKTIESTGDDLRKNMIPLAQFSREPSIVLYNIVNLLIQYADRIAGTTEAMSGENVGQNTKAGTFNGMIEQGMQVHNMIFKRVWRSMKEEFKKRHQLNARYLPQRTTFGAPGKDNFILQEDYKTNPDFVVPSADPNIVSKQMKVQRAAVIAQRAATVPGYDLEACERNLLCAMEVEGYQTLFVGKDKLPPPPPDPKITLEQQKLKLESMKLAQQKNEFMIGLMEERRMNTAKIIALYAAASKDQHDASMDVAGHQLESFKTYIEALETHNSMINERIAALTGEGGDSESGSDPSGGGVPQLANGSGDPGLSGAPQGVPPGANGAMG